MRSAIIWRFGREELMLAIGWVVYVVLFLCGI